MKTALHRIALVLIIGLGITLLSCSKDETFSFVVPTESILISSAGDRGSTKFDTSNIASIEVTLTPKGWSVVDIDLYKGSITVQAPSTFEDGEVTEGTLILTGYTPTGSTQQVKVYVAILPNEDIDFYSEQSNCYIITQSNTRYKFNPYVGGTSQPLETDHIELLWESSKDLIQYIDLSYGKASFYVGSSDDDNKLVKPGNALIGAFDADGTLLWSWHIWVTNNNPTAAENVTTLGGREMMLMNLGASEINDGSGDTQKILGSYGLYYQWGRRTPLPGPFSWDFKLNEDGRMYNNQQEMIYLDYVDSTAETGTNAWSDLNPMAVIKGNPTNGYNWIYSEVDNTLWDANHKTNNDPCPRGWRVPDSSIFANLTIAEKDDAMSWEEAQPMYGWRLKDTDTNKEYFFTAAGRRNYLDGRLDNMNTNAELPVPWSGYYWTVTTDGANAMALYFNLNTNTRTWNGFEAARPMQRANAMPIRCVRE